MKWNSKIVLAAVLAVFSFVVIANSALAIDSTAQQKALGGLKSTADSAKLQAGDPATTIGKAISLVIAISSLILLIITVYGGIQWMTAGGNKEQVSKARSMIIEGVIGLMICLAAYALTSYVVTQITTVTGGASPDEAPTSQSPNCIAECLQQEMGSQQECQDYCA